MVEQPFWTMVLLYSYTEVPVVERSESISRQIQSDVPMSTVTRSSDDRPKPAQFTLRGALAVYSLLCIIVSIPLLGFGFALTALIFGALFVLQFPIFVLLGAFDTTGQPGQELPNDFQEWDRWRNERGRAD
jgi:hypothetical protein